MPFTTSNDEKPQRKQLCGFYPVRESAGALESYEEIVNKLYLFENTFKKLFFFFLICIFCCLINFEPEFNTIFNVINTKVIFMLHHNGFHKR